MVNSRPKALPATSSKQVVKMVAAWLVKDSGGGVMKIKWSGQERKEGGLEIQER